MRSSTSAFSGGSSSSRPAPTLAVLRRDPVAQLLGVGVVVALRLPVGGEPVEQLHGHRQRLGVRLARRDGSCVDVLARHDLVGEAHRRHGQHAVERSDGGEVLLVAHHHAADADPGAIVHRRQQQPVGLLGRVAVGRQPVGALVVDRVDLVEGDEVGDLDRPRALRPQLLQLVLVERDVAAGADLEAHLDVVGVDLLAGLLRHLAIADARAGLLVQLVEVDVVVAHRAERLHRDVHQSEADRSGPEWSCHGGPVPISAFVDQVPQAALVARQPGRLGRRGAVPRCGQVAVVVGGVDRRVDVAAPAHGQGVAEVVGHLAHRVVDRPAALALGRRRLGGRQQRRAHHRRAPRAERLRRRAGARAALQVGVDVGRADRPHRAVDVLVLEQQLTGEVLAGVDDPGDVRVADRSRRSRGPTCR